MVEGTWGDKKGLVSTWRLVWSSYNNKKGYEALREVLPITSWETTKQYRQSSSKTTPISNENLQLMVQEMERRKCKGIGGIHWDEMIIKEGIVLCKRTGKVVGFEDKNISDEYNARPEELSEEKSDDESSCCNSCSDSFSDDSLDEEQPNLDNDCSSGKAKIIFQFFFSSLEGDFLWPVASFPLQKTNHQVLSSLIWQVCEALGNLNIGGQNKIQVIYGVCDGSTYSHAFFSRSGAQDWVTYNPYNDNKPIWWLSDYPHMIKKLRNFIVDPEKKLSLNGNEIRIEHIINVIERKLTKVKWEHIKLTARTKMSVKRAVNLCSSDVAIDVLKGSFPVEDTILTRDYINKCHRLFQILNDSSGVNPCCYKELIQTMLWFDKWFEEVNNSYIPNPKGKREHWKKFIPRITYKDNKRTIRAFLGIVQYIQLNNPDVHIIPKTMCQDDVENYFSLQRARSGRRETNISAILWVISFLD